MSSKKALSWIKKIEEKNHSFLKSLKERIDERWEKAKKDGYDKKRHWEDVRKMLQEKHSA